MPILSTFYGILIYMNRKKEHNPPHIHAEYGEFEASFNFDGETIAGKFPLKQTKIVAAWIAIHKDELEAMWKLAMAGEKIDRIAPLSL